MTNCKDCKKKFKQIVKGKENEGYSEWVKWIEDEVKGYDKEKMQNLIKRYEIKLKKVKEDDGFRAFSIMAQVVNVLVVMITLVTNVSMTSLITNIGIYSFDSGSNSMQEFANIVNDTMLEMKNILMAMVTSGCVILCIGLLLGKIIDTKYSIAKNENKVYYEELLLVLREILEKK